MDGVANMADIMLVLAVGIMVALVINWKVDIPSAASQLLQTEAVDKSEAVPFSEEDIEQVEDGTVIHGGEMQKLGTVYYDQESDTYYIIHGNDAAPSEAVD